MVCVGLTVSNIMTEFGTNAEDTNAFLMMAVAIRAHAGIPIAAFEHNDWMKGQLEKVRSQTLS